MDGKAPTLSPFRFLAALQAWWSLRVFPSPTQGGHQSHFEDRFVLHGLLLAVMCCALLLTRLSCPLLEPEEARYAEIPRQMLEEGRFVEPVLHGQPYYQKPPLLYWLVMLSYSIFGVHDWAARLVPALASLATVFVTWLWGRRAFGPQVGLVGGVILILSGRFVYLGRMLTIDPLLSLWVTAALAMAYQGVRGQGSEVKAGGSGVGRQAPILWHWWLGSALLTGLGVLTKGPVALVLTLAPVMVLQVLDCRCARLSPRALAVYVIVAVGVACPWFGAMTVLNPEAAGEFFWLHNVQRYLDPVDHEEPVWFFLPSLLIGTLPWSLLLVPLIRWLLLPEKNGRDVGAPEAGRPPALGFALLALGWCVAFFSLSGCKRPVYILPALPWLAVCLGCCACQAPWPRLMSRRFRRPRGRGVGVWNVTAAIVFALLLVGVYGLLPGYHRRFALRGQVRRHLDAGTEVFCYPKRWDSITFYLQRTDVHVFSAEQRASLLAALEARPGALVFVKRPWLDALVRDLPPGLEFVPLGRQSDRMRVGLVRPRQDVASGRPLYFSVGDGGVQGSEKEKEQE